MASSGKSKARQDDIPGPMSKLFFWYVSPIIKTARERGSLDLVDIPVHVQLATVELYERFKEVWSTRKTKRTVDVVMSICAGQWLTIFLTGLGYIASQGSTLAGPLLLGRIVMGLVCRGLPGCQSEKTTYMCDSPSTALLLYILFLYKYGKDGPWPLISHCGAARRSASSSWQQTQYHSHPIIFTDRLGSIQVRAVCDKLCMCHLSWGTAAKKESSRSVQPRYIQAMQHMDVYHTWWKSFSV
jgi:hypothetical protein